MKYKERSDSSHAILDKKSRGIKANKIVSTLEKYAGNLDGKVILDIGTGAGYIANSLAKKSKAVTSVDVVDERSEKRGYKFQLVDSEKLPYRANSFDIVISNHVIEHVTNQRIHIDEIFRVLKKGGFLYLATPNKWWFTDPHYRLPFISWLPRKVSNRYLKLIKGSEMEWDIYPVSYGTLRDYLDMRFDIENPVGDIIKNPEEYHLDTFKVLHPVMKRMPVAFIRLANPITPTFIFVFIKKG